MPTRIGRSTWRPRAATRISVSRRSLGSSPLARRRRLFLRFAARSGLPRMLSAFDPRRTAILLVAGDKSHDDRWYGTNVPVADRLLEEHRRAIDRERAEPD
ncbi:MAG: type II toxin-antitoxin system RelE/ParE family toxin [Acidobacteria bacterium]|nr:type II toxin-antitoxin system RelE/ParE family toxin [Acidobacteriota bacterium]